MNCPLCIDQMLAPHYRAGIEIDVCPNCRGVWLDRNELESLVGADHRAAPAPPGAVAGGAAPGGDGSTGSAKSPPEDSKKPKGKKSKKKKKKSWGDLLGDALEEVLDF